MSEPLKCCYILEDSRQCGAYALAGKSLCFSHDPDSREAKLEAVTKGGQVREMKVFQPLTRVEIEVPQDVVTLLVQTISEVRSGELDPRVATTIGNLTGHLLKAYEVAQNTNRLDAIEATLKDLPTRLRKSVYAR
jgi:hypothetical protein